MAMVMSAAHRNSHFWPIFIPTAHDGLPYSVSCFECSCWLSEDEGNILDWFHVWFIYMLLFSDDSVFEFV